MQLTPWKAPATTGTRNPMTPAPTPAPTPPATQFPTAHFTFRGREYRIFKRTAGPKAKWYLYFEREKKRIKRCLGDTAKAAAIENAKLQVQAILDGNKEAARKLMERPGVTGISTVGELLDTYDTLPGPASRAAYVWCLKTILRKVHPGRDVLTLPCSVFADNTAERYFAMIYEEAAAKPTQRLQQRHKRSANSMFRQAKSILSDRSVSALRQAGLLFPDPKPFTGALKKHGFKKVNTAGFELPGDDVIRTMLVQWKKMTDRPMFLAVGLALAGGLRKGEIAQARWGWFSERMGVPLIYSDAVTLDDDTPAGVRVKNQSGSLEVVPLEPFWRIFNRTIERHKWRGKPDELVLAGVADLRDVFGGISDWLRSIGWNTQKRIHAMRDYGASLITMKYGLDYAKVWCRHSTITTTEKHYSRFVDPVQMVQRRKKLKWLRFAGEDSTPTKPA
jgi:integrase